MEIDGYMHNSTLTSGDWVTLGTQVILICRFVGLSNGEPLDKLHLGLSKWTVYVLS